MYRLKSSRVTLAAGSSNVHVDGEGTYIHRAGGFGNAELIRTWHACGYSIRIHREQPVTVCMQTCAQKRVKMEIGLLCTYCIYRQVGQPTCIHMDTQHIM